jgi:hypothetical protein
MTVPAEVARDTVRGGGESRLHRLIGPAAGVLFGLVVIVLAQSIQEPAIDTSFSPRWWPEILGGVIIALSLGVAIKEIAAPGPADEEIEPRTREGVIRVLAVLGAIAAYGVLWYFTIFPVATVILFVALVFILGARGWKALLLFPVVCTAVLYGLFGLLLKVPL